MESSALYGEFLDLETGFSEKPEYSSRLALKSTEKPAVENEGHPLLSGLRAAKANLAPGLVVQATMLAVVLAYYFWPPAQSWLKHLAAIKNHFGYGFSFCSGALAGGLLPELLKIALFQKGRVNRENCRNMAFGFLFWGISATVVDGLYRAQAAMFGSRADFSTVTKKVLVDQFIYNPFWSAPFGVAAFEWKNQQFRVAGMSRAFTATFYKKKTLPALVATWGVWIPLVSLVYALPSPLQIPLFSLALTFWVLIFAWMNRGQS